MPENCCEYRKTPRLTCRAASQHTQEKVHLLIQLAESMLAKGHAHRTELRRCVSTVDKRYRDFTVRMGQYRHLLETALGGCSQVRDLKLNLKTNAAGTFVTVLYGAPPPRTTRTWSWS